MITITPLDNVWVRLDCDDAIAQELSEYFTFEVPGARHMPAFRNRHWKGHIRLFKLRSRTLYRGLVPRVLEFAVARDYAIVDKTPAVPALLMDIASWGLSNLPSQFELRDYQINSIRACLTHRRQIVLSPTGSGKSLSIYATICIVQNMLVSVQHKTLVIVPTLGLAQQMLNDFREYGYTPPIHVITGGVEKATDTAITISTWQSIYEQEETYFDQFACVVVDEVHLAKAASLKGILERCTAAPYRFGFTGTLDDTLCHRLVLEGLLGTIMTASTTHALVQRGQLAPLVIKLMVLEYPEGVKALNRRDNKAYEDEINFLVGYGPRTACLVELVKHLKGNTLVLFQFVEKQGRELFERIQAACPTRTVHYYAGSVAADDREAIRQSLAETDAAIVVASYGTFSLGVNVPNLKNIIFAHPSKSKYRVMQSIGRSLRTHAAKTHATLYDVLDDLRIGKYVNKTFTHAQERLLFYAAEKFKVKLIPVPVAMLSVSKRDTSGGFVSHSGTGDNLLQYST